MAGQNDEMVTINCVCPVCGMTNFVEVRKSDYHRHLENPKILVQDLYPYLSDDERELLISGVCNECWESIFPDDEEDQ